ncbi:hypothetical protein D3C73_1368560 [compost metagenome]
MVQAYFDGSHDFFISRIRMACCGYDAFLTQEPDQIVCALAFRSKGYLFDKTWILLFPGLYPAAVRRHNMSRILSAGPFWTDERSFEMDARQLCIWHFTVNVLMNLFQHLFNDRFGKRHRGGQH